MQSTLELAYQHPAGFWVCDYCYDEMYDQAEGDDMEVTDLDIQYITDLSVTHCTRCDYEPETGLRPVRLDFI